MDTKRKIDIETLKWNDYHISNLIIDYLKIGFTRFDSQVIIENCIIENLEIHSTWFQKGCILRGCIIKNDIDYQMGGHNLFPIEIKQNIFEDFLGFFDCHFDEVIILSNNIFQKGSNLLGNIGEGYQNMFNSGVVIDNNMGNLKVNRC